MSAQGSADAVSLLRQLGDCDVGGNADADPGWREAQARGGVLRPDAPPHTADRAVVVSPAKDMDPFWTRSSAASWALASDAGHGARSAGHSP